MGRSNRYKQAVREIDRSVLYPITDAVALLKTLPTGKFDESVDVAINLGVDPKHADQMVRGAVGLPHGTGKSVRILVFAKGDKDHEAREAGADHVGAEDLAQKIQNEGWMDFDRVIATPDMMGVVGRLGRVLGPRGLMPNPKLGTVTQDVGRAVSEQKAGKVEYRVDKHGIVHCSIGKASMEAQQLLDNICALVDVINKQRPATTKGTYFKRMALSTTMGPGLRIEPATAVALAGEAAA
jgi:large subunit ribosomal protein L1